MNKRAKVPECASVIPFDPSAMARWRTMLANDVLVINLLLWIYKDIYEINRYSHGLVLPSAAVQDVRDRDWCQFLRLPKEEKSKETCGLVKLKIGKLDTSSSKVWIKHFKVDFAIASEGKCSASIRLVQRLTKAQTECKRSHFSEGRIDANIVSPQHKADKVIRLSM